MSWVALDDGFWMHPKVVQAGNAGAGIFARMLSYCGCYLTDGLVPHFIVAQIVGVDPDHHDALKLLEDAGMIERMESGAVWIPDYLEMNPSKEKVERDRAQRREAGRRGGLARSAGPNGKRPAKRPLAKPPDGSPSNR